MYAHSSKSAIINHNFNYYPNKKLEWLHTHAISIHVHVYEYKI